MITSFLWYDRYILLLPNSSLFRISYLTYYFYVHNNIIKIIIIAILIFSFVQYIHTHNAYTYLTSISNFNGDDPLVFWWYITEGRKHITVMRIFIHAWKKKKHFLIWKLINSHASLRYRLSLLVIGQPLWPIRTLVSAEVMTNTALSIENWLSGCSKQYIT